MEDCYSILGIKKDASIEDVKTAFRVNTLHNSDNYQDFENAYEKIINDKESGTNSQLYNNIPYMEGFINNSDHGINNIKGLTGLPIMFATHIGNNQGINDTNDINNDINNLISGIFNSNNNYNSSNNTSNNSSNNNKHNPIESILGEIADKMFNFKDKLNSFKDVNKEYNNNIEHIINLNKEITIYDLYNNLNIGKLFNIDNLNNIHLLDIVLNKEYQLCSILDNNEKYTYIVNITLKDHNTNFKIIDKKLYYIIDISLKDAICGFEFTFDHLNGKQYTIKNNKKIIKPDSEIKLINLGLNYGDLVSPLIINFNIIFPDEINDNNKDELRKIL